MAEINVCYQCCLLEMVAFEVQITQFLYWKSLSLLYRQNPGRRAQHYFHNWIFQFSSTERYQPQCIICLQAKAQENFECLRSLLLPSLPNAPPPPSFSRIFLNFIIAMFWHSVGIFWNFYRYHHFRTDGTFSVVVTPPKPSSFLWLQTELDSTQSYSDHYLSHEICLCMYSVVKKTRKWCLPTQKKFLQKLLREKKIPASWILPTLLTNHFTTSITATATTKLYLRDHASTYSIAKDNYNNYFLRIWTKF